MAIWWLPDDCLVIGLVIGWVIGLVIGLVICRRVYGNHE